MGDVEGVWRTKTTRVEVAIGSIFSIGLGLVLLAGVSLAVPLAFFGGFTESPTGHVFSVVFGLFSIWKGVELLAEGCRTVTVDFRARRTVIEEIGLLSGQIYETRYIPFTEIVGTEIHTQIQSAGDGGSMAWYEFALRLRCGESVCVYGSCARRDVEARRTYFQVYLTDNSERPVQRVGLQS